jgi:hypothetical protein
MTKELEALKLALEALEAVAIEGDVACVVKPDGAIYLRPAIAAIREALAQPVQPGYRLVPLVPTDAMQVFVHKQAWINAVNAAPLPVQEPEPPAGQPLCEPAVATISITRRGSSTTIDNHFEDCVRDWPEGEYKLVLAPPLPVQPQQTHETLERELEQALQQRQNRDAVLTDIANLIGVEFSSAYKFADLVRDLDERIANPPLPVQEPVIFTWDDCLKTVARVWGALGDCTPLPAQPPLPVQAEQITSGWSLRYVYFDENGIPLMHREPEERNFCPRCGKRTADPATIHTCTPPQIDPNQWAFDNGLEST